MPRSPKGGEDLEVETTDDSELGPHGVAESAALDEDSDLDEDVGEEDEEFEAVPATAAGKASALRLIELLVEKKSLLLLAKKPGAKLIESVARLLESPLPLKVRANKLSDTIVDSEDVDEFFLDDETLIELLKRW